MQLQCTTLHCNCSYPHCVPNIYGESLYNMSQNRLARCILCCTVICCTVLYCTVLYSTVPHCTILCYTTEKLCTVIHCIVLIIASIYLFVVGFDISLQVSKVKFIHLQYSSVQFSPVHCTNVQISHFNTVTSLLLHEEGPQRKETSDQNQTKRKGINPTESSWHQHLCTFWTPVFL